MYVFGRVSLTALAPDILRDVFFQMVIEYALPLVIISIAYGRMGTRLWLTRTPGTAQDKRDECILSNKKKVRRSAVDSGDQIRQFCSLFGIQ